MNDDSGYIFEQRRLPIERSYSFTPDNAVTMMCRECGAYVDDEVAHVAWHERVAPKNPPTHVEIGAQIDALEAKVAEFREAYGDGNLPDHPTLAEWDRQ